MEDFPRVKIPYSVRTNNEVFHVCCPEGVTQEVAEDLLEVFQQWLKEREA